MNTQTLLILALMGGGVYMMTRPRPPVFLPSSGVDDTGQSGTTKGGTGRSATDKAGLALGIIGGIATLTSGVLAAQGSSH